MTRWQRVSTALFLSAFLIAPVSALADVEDFSGPVAGTVVAGTLPQGGSAPGTLFPKMTISVTNNNGPHTAIIFDSGNPTGGDPDLGAPNNTCPGGGPGVGTGGQVGMPGENCAPQGNLLIIAEDLGDSNTDNIVDDPDDEVSGGTIVFDFDDVVVVTEVVILDIDSESAQFILENDGTLKGTVNASDLGDNSAQTLDLSSYGEITCLELSFSSSGAISSIEFFEATVPVKETSWGKIKSFYDTSE